jgi:hypothetical protein
VARWIIVFESMLSVSPVLRCGTHHCHCVGLADHSALTLQLALHLHQTLGIN